MKFTIRFKIGNRFGAASKYTLREFCLFIIERFGLTETEICTIVTLHPTETWKNEDMLIQRVEDGATERRAKQQRSAKS
jgi:hypothetical protein